ncbi:MAG: hypothetical protein HOG39_02675 [Candidatus Marinimicrobia bacterium]|nr:hypothetical protein [Candidatus Neomarinimicrobiota bacterium]
MIRFQNSLKDMIWKFSDKKGYAGFNKLEEIAEEIKLYPEIYSAEEVLQNENKILKKSKNEWKSLFGPLLITIFSL